MTERDEERDKRIEMEIIVDAYTADEQAMGWHIYLEETMEFPFEAHCIEDQEVSPLEKGETVRVVGKPSSEPTLRQQFVTIEWMDREFGVPLSQLEPIEPVMPLSKPCRTGTTGSNDNITSVGGEGLHTDDDLPVPHQIRIRSDLALAGHRRRCGPHTR